jgi:hypothetical protein
MRTAPVFSETTEMVLFPALVTHAVLGFGSATA